MSQRIQTEWTIADIIDFEVFCQRDKNCLSKLGDDPDASAKRKALKKEFERRDEDIATAIYKDDPRPTIPRRELFHRWLVHRRQLDGDPEESSPGAKVKTAITGFSIALAVVGAFAALGVFKVFYRFPVDEASPVNVSWFFPFAVTIPFLLTLYAFWVAVGKGNAKRFQLPPVVTSLALDVVTPIHRKIRSYCSAGSLLSADAVSGALRAGLERRKGVISAFLFRWIQFLGIGFALTLVLCMVLDRAYSDRQFRYGTTVASSVATKKKKRVDLVSLPWFWAPRVDTSTQQEAIRVERENLLRREQEKRSEIEGLEEKVEMPLPPGESHDAAVAEELIRQKALLGRLKEDLARLEMQRTDLEDARERLQNLRFGIPSLDQVAAVAKQGRIDLEALPLLEQERLKHTWEAWANFLILSVIIYVLIPRLILLLVSWRGLNKELLEEDFSEMEYDNLHKRIRPRGPFPNPPPETGSEPIKKHENGHVPESKNGVTSGSQTQTERQSSPSPKSDPALTCVVGISTDLFSELQADVASYFTETEGWIVAACLPIPQDTTGKGDFARSLPAVLSDSGASRLVLVEDVRVNPVQMQEDFLRDLRKCVGEKPGIVVALFTDPFGSALPETQLMVWQKKVQALGDSNLRVTSIHRTDS